MILYDSKTLKDNKVYYHKFDSNLNLIRDIQIAISYYEKPTRITLDELKNMIGAEDLIIEDSYILYCPETGSRAHIGEKMTLLSNTHILQNRDYVFDRVIFPRFEFPIPDHMKDLGHVGFIDTCVVELKDANNEDGEPIILIKRDCCEKELNDVGHCTFFDDYTGDCLKMPSERMKKLLLEPEPKEH